MNHWVVIVVLCVIIVMMAIPWDSNAKEPTDEEKEVRD